MATVTDLPSSAALKSHQPPAPRFPVAAAATTQLKRCETEQWSTSDMELTVIRCAASKRYYDYLQVSHYGASQIRRIWSRSSASSVASRPPPPSGYIRSRWDSSRNCKHKDPVGDSWQRQEDTTSEGDRTRTFRNEAGTAFERWCEMEWSQTTRLFHEAST